MNMRLSKYFFEFKYGVFLSFLRNNTINKKIIIFFTFRRKLSIVNIYFLNVLALQIIKQNCEQKNFFCTIIFTITSNHRQTAVNFVALVNRF